MMMLMMMSSSHASALYLYPTLDTLKSHSDPRIWNSESGIAFVFGIAIRLWNDFVQKLHPDSI